MAPTSQVRAFVILISSIKENYMIRHLAGLEWNKFYAKFCENGSSSLLVQMQCRQRDIDQIFSWPRKLSLHSF
jgi:hypothetical protein